MAITMTAEDCYYVWRDGSWPSFEKLPFAHQKGWRRVANHGNLCASRRGTQYGDEVKKYCEEAKDAEIARLNELLRNRGGPSPATLTVGDPRILDT